MRLTRQAALAIALVAGLLAALFAWMFIGQQNKPAPKVVEKVQVPVPIRSLPAGTELTVDMFRPAEFPRDQLPTTVVMDTQSLGGRIAVGDLPQDQPVRAELVRERSAQLGMAYALNEGLRGMAVSLDVVGNVGDFVKPLDHVDVLTAFRQDNQVVVRTLVQDVVVLAIGATVTAPPPVSTTEETSETKKEETGPRKVETPVTLALTPAQAQTILTADMAGDLRLTLRSKDDRALVPLPSANSWTMVGKIPGKGQAAGAAGQGQKPASATAATPQPGAAIAPGTVGVSVTTGSPAPATPRLPKKPYVEVIRGDAREIVVP